MDYLSIPYDKASAQAVMAQFNDYAADNRYYDKFTEALSIIYKEDYKIVYDSTIRRMNFHCIKCSKSMNNTQSLHAHNVSNKHLKTIGWGVGTAEASQRRSVSSQFREDSIQHQLMVSRAEIVGVHMVEQYISRRKPQAYYKCLLCGAHGRLDAIVKHMIGDKHTDKYIRLRVEGGMDIVGDKRAAIRSFIREKEDAMEGFNVDAIKTYRREDLFPFKWEDDGRPDEYLENKYKGTPSSPVPPLRRLPHASGPLDYHMAGPSAARPKVMRSKGGVIMIKDEGVGREDKAAQAYSVWNVERLLDRLCFVCATKDLPGAGMSSPADAREALTLMFSLANLLFFCLETRRERQARPGARRHTQTAIELVKKMQGAVTHIMMADFDCRFPRHRATTVVSQWQLAVRQAATGC